MFQENTKSHPEYWIVYGIVRFILKIILLTFCERKTSIQVWTERKSSANSSEKQNRWGLTQTSWNKLQFVTPCIPQRGGIAAAFLSQETYWTDSLRPLRNSREISDERSHARRAIPAVYPRLQRYKCHATQIEESWKDETRERERSRVSNPPFHPPKTSGWLWQYKSCERGGEASRCWESLSRGDESLGIISAKF